MRLVGTKNQPTVATQSHTQFPDNNTYFARNKRFCPRLIRYRTARRLACFYEEGDLQPIRKLPWGLITHRENYYVSSTKEAAFIFCKVVYSQPWDQISEQWGSHDVERLALHPCDSWCSSVTESLRSFEKNSQALVPGILRWGLGVQVCLMC